MGCRRTAIRTSFSIRIDTGSLRSLYADAQRVADAHELDLYPNAKTIDDGFSRLPDPEIDWRSIPHQDEERANWHPNGWLDLAVTPARQGAKVERPPRAKLEFVQLRPM